MDIDFSFINTILLIIILRGLVIISKQLRLLIDLYQVEIGVKPNVKSKR